MKIGGHIQANVFIKSDHMQCIFEYIYIPKMPEGNRFREVHLLCASHLLLILHFQL